MKNMKGFIITWFDWVVWRHPIGAVGISWCSSTILLIFFCWIEGSWAEAVVVAVSFSSDQVVKRLNFVV
jgi:hypothetical protein